MESNKQNELLRDISTGFFQACNEQLRTICRNVIGGRGDWAAFSERRNNEWQLTGKAFSYTSLLESETRSKSYYLRLHKSVREAWPHDSDWEITDIIEKNTETLIHATKEVGLEINVEKTKYMLLLVTRMQVKIVTEIAKDRLKMCHSHWFAQVRVW
jgi:hypothetical protein